MISPFLCLRGTPVSQVSFGSFDLIEDAGDFLLPDMRMLVVMMLLRVIKFDFSLVRRRNTISRSISKSKEGDSRPLLPACNCCLAGFVYLSSSKSLFNSSSRAFFFFFQFSCDINPSFFTLCLLDTN